MTDRLPIYGATAVEGLYAATGLGSRGLLWAPLGAELIACVLEGEPCPLARHVGRHLAAAVPVVKPSMRPDLSSLALFIRVAETKSITKAAAASHIALAAASRRIAQLEDQFGVELLRRSARGVDLTAAGEALLYHARQMMDQVDQMRAEISDYTMGAKGLVRMQANASALAQYLPEDLASFSTAHPAIKVSLGEERSSAIVAALLAGERRRGHRDGGGRGRRRRCSASTTAPTRSWRSCRCKHPVRAQSIAFDGCSTTISWGSRATP